MACCLLGAMVLAQWLALWEIVRNRASRAWAFFLRRPLPPRLTSTVDGAGWRFWRRLLLWELLATVAAAIVFGQDEATPVRALVKHVEQVFTRFTVTDLCTTPSQLSQTTKPSVVGVGRKSGAVENGN